MRPLAKLKEDVVCRDGNIIPADTSFVINEDGLQLKDKYHCFTPPEEDDQYLVYISKDKLEIIGETDAEISEFLRNFL